MKGVPQAAMFELLAYLRAIQAERAHEDDSPVHGGDEEVRESSDYRLYEFKKGPVNVTRRRPRSNSI